MSRAVERTSVHLSDDGRGLRGDTLSRKWRSVVVLSGGVGGARLVHGLHRVLSSPSESAGAHPLTVIVNTGDDFEHWGLSISPDLDTVMYTLADLANVERGWGLAVETFAAFEGVRRYGGDDWFALGDRDLATHLVRTQALARGEPLTDVTARLCRALGVSARVLPMSDAPRRTMIDTIDFGTLSFQEWFVRLGARPPVVRVWFDVAPPPNALGETAPGAPSASRESALLRAIREAELVIVAPSNPYVSVDPILAVPGIRDAVRARPVVAVSPIVSGHAVKGPLGGMIEQLTGARPSAAAIAAHYAPDLAGIVVERGDEAEIRGSVGVLATETVMRGRDDSARLALELLNFSARLVG